MDINKMSGLIIEAAMRVHSGLVRACWKAHTKLVYCTNCENIGKVESQVALPVLDDNVKSM